jgi:hypothetical protein
MSNEEQDKQIMDMAALISVLKQMEDADALDLTENYDQL